MNPFAPPQTDITTAAASGAGAGGFYVRDNVLVVRKGTVLPNVCIATGDARGAERVHKKLYWSPPWSVVLSPLIALLLRKSGEIDYSLGPVAKQRRMIGIATGIGGSLLGLGLMIVGPATDSPVIMITGFLIFFVALLFALIYGRVIHIVRIDKTDIHLKLKPESAQVFARLSAGGGSY